jgi:hypothetical protein
MRPEMKIPVFASNSELRQLPAKYRRALLFLARHKLSQTFSLSPQCSGIGPVRVNFTTYGYSHCKILPTISEARCAAFCFRRSPNNWRKSAGFLKAIGNGACSAATSRSSLTRAINGFHWWSSSALVPLSAIFSRLAETNPLSSAQMNDAEKSSSRIAVVSMFSDEYVANKFLYSLRVRRRIGSRDLTIGAR